MTYFAETFTIESRDDGPDDHTAVIVCTSCGASRTCDYEPLTRIVADAQRHTVTRHHPMRVRAPWPPPHGEARFTRVTVTRYDPVTGIPGVESIPLRRPAGRW